MEEEVQHIDDTDQLAYEEALIKEWGEDFTAAERFLTDFHRQCVEANQRYHNALEYENLRKSNKFPTTFYQEQEDNFVAYVMDKLFYKSRPCTVVGTEETDEADADAKQAMLDWQDYKDKIYQKIEQFVRDCARYRVAVAQVDYAEKTRRKVVGGQEPMLMPDGFGGVVPLTDVNGQPVMRSFTQVKDIVAYKGPTVKRIDPINFFITEDKSRLDDEHPIMIREFKPRSYFKDNKKMFFNLERLPEVIGSKDTGETGSEVPDNIYHKRLARGLKPEQAKASKNLEYVEWHGWVNKLSLYKYLGYPLEAEDEQGNMVPVAEPDDKCLVVGGMIERKLLVRLEETPFDFNLPNIVVGTIQGDEDELIGTSIFDKLYSIANGLDVLQGILLENFKQSVNAMHVINVNALADSNVIVNKAGAIIKTNTDVNKVHKRVEQAPVSQDIYGLREIWTTDGKRASGIQDIISGIGQPQAETLGEAEIIAGSASQRMTNYIKSFEETLIEPLYDMRNQINMQFLDEEYIYGVIGESAIDWRMIQPGQIRANIDFMCESATRETNRVVITQQIIQSAKLLPLVQAAGLPIRPDKLMKRLYEQGFAWDEKAVEELLPSLKLEKAGVDIDTLLLQQSLMMLAMGGAMGGPPSTGGNQPNPTSEQDANQSMRNSNDTQIPRSA